MPKNFKTIALLSLMVFLLPSGHLAWGADDLGVSIIPQPESGTTRSWFVYNVGAGSTINDAAIIINASSGRSLKVKIYPVDAQKAGEAFLPASKDTPRETVGQWLQVGESALSLAPFAKKLAPFTIKIPVNAQPQQYYGALIAEEAGSDTGEGGVNIQTRVGARIYLTVTGEAASKTEIPLIALDQPLPPHKAPAPGPSKSTASITKTPVSPTAVAAKQTDTATVAAPSAASEELPTGQVLPLEEKTGSPEAENPDEDMVKTAPAGRRFAGEIMETIISSPLVKRLTPGSAAPVWPYVIEGAIPLLLIFFWRRRKKKQDQDNDQPNKEHHQPK